MVTVKGASRHNWKVVWYVDPGPTGVAASYHLKRFSLGRREAKMAWKLFWGLRGKPWVLQGPELWRGRVRVL